MNVGLIQIGAQEEKEKSLALAEEYILKAAGSGADIIMLPEMFNCPYNTENFPIYAEPEGGPCWTRMSDAARNCGKYLIAGSMPECDSKGRVYNTSYVFGPDGNQLAKHRKMHLFDIAVKGGQFFRESETLTAGDQVTIFDTEFGRFGVMICYDIRFPELSRLIALQGAVMIFVPACFNMTTGPAHWELAFRARALDNQVFMAGCSQARQNSGYISYGHSLVTSPWGDVVGKMDEREGLLVCEIDPDQVRKVREELPFLKQRRTDVYSLCAPSPRLGCKKDNHDEAYNISCGR